MPLQSQLFKGDQKLEAAAVSDPAHITLGAKGEHVRKIQLALIQLDGARIDADAQYGPATAAAVLAYKKKRNIINPSYQTQADDIVGKMTMASLDSEMLLLESRPQAPLAIVPLSNWSVRPVRHAVLEELMNGQKSPQLNFAVDATSAGATPVGAPRILPVPNPNPNSNVVLRMQTFDTGTIQVLNAGPNGVLEVEDTSLISIKAPDSSALRWKVSVTKDLQTFEIKSTDNLGVSKLTVTKARIKEDDLFQQQSIDVAVAKIPGRPRFRRGIDHNHQPAHKWSEIQKNPNNLKNGSSSDIVADMATRLCKNHPTPEESVEETMEGVTSGFFWGTKPLAKKHVQWYLDGSGADFIEDANITEWLRIDPGIRSRLRQEIFPKKNVINADGHFTFDSTAYGHGNLAQDFHLAFGAIDRVDFEVDFGLEIVRVWFQDRYEWHPYYPGIYQVKKGNKEFPKSGDTHRATNSIHAAMVEMKDRQDGKPKAKDYWMIGVGEIKLYRLTLPDIL